ncbi:unnamed protein product [Rhizophagus irregularis]|nr:unnamed protein product [Rhizophagus irregularis]
MENKKILEKCGYLEKELADSGLANGLMITELGNRIRNLEADVAAKERIILEKNEVNNILWEKIKALEEKEKEPTCKDTNMQKKKKCPNKKRKRARAQHTKNGMIIETELGAIGDKDKDRPNDWNQNSRPSGSWMEWNQQSGTSAQAASSRTHKQWR